MDPLNEALPIMVFNTVSSSFCSAATALQRAQSQIVRCRISTHSIYVATLLANSTFPLAFA